MLTQSFLILCIQLTEDESKRERGRAFASLKALAQKVAPTTSTNSCFTEKKSEKCHLELCNRPLRKGRTDLGGQPASSATHQSKNYHTTCHSTINEAF